MRFGVYDVKIGMPNAFLSCLFSLIHESICFLLPVKTHISVLRRSQSMHVNLVNNVESSHFLCRDRAKFDDFLRLALPNITKYSIVFHF